MPGRERFILLQAALLLPALALAVRLFGFTRLFTALNRRYDPARLPSPADPAAALGRARHAVSLAARHSLYRGNCLSQSLALWLLLRRQGIAADLRIGVRKEFDRLLAHAWVEYRGQPLNDSPFVSERYTPFTQSILPHLAHWR